MPLTIVLIPFISTVVNGTLLNFAKRYEDNFLRVIFDQRPKLHLCLDALSNQKIMNGIYSIDTIWHFVKFRLLSSFVGAVVDTTT